MYSNGISASASDCGVTKSDLKDTETCPNVDLCATPQQWGEWNACDKSCGTGERKRTRECFPNGASCEEDLEEKEDCNTQTCPGKSDTMDNILDMIAEG